MLAASMPPGLLVRERLRPNGAASGPIVLSMVSKLPREPWRPELRDLLLPAPRRLQAPRPRLARRIEEVCWDTGAPRVDVVSHSLGALVARHLVELGDGSRVRRLVTLGSPYYSERRPARELAIFAGHDPLVPPRGDRRGCVVVVEDCGHLSLLQHPAVLHAVARFLRMRVASGAPEVGAAA